MRPLRSFLLLLIFLACFTGLHYIIPVSHYFPAITEFVNESIIQCIHSGEKSADELPPPIFADTIQKPASDTLRLAGNDSLTVSWILSDPVQSFLDSLKAGEGQMRIIYYGDSQIEGDRITSYLRHYLRKYHGGTGPGLFLPLMPVMYTKTLWLRSSSNWERYNYLSYNSGKISHNRFGPFMTVCRYLPEGVKRRVAEKAFVKIRPSSLTDSASSEFDLIRIFYSNMEGVVNVVINVDNNQVYADTLKRGRGVNELRCQLGSAREVTVEFTGKVSPDIYGISIESKSGLILDNIPQRGSAGLEFTMVDRDNLSESYKKLSPDLFILQYGLNLIKSTREDFSFYQKGLERQLALLQEISPGTPIIVISLTDVAAPDGDSIKSYKNIPAIIDAQRNASLAQGAMFWDSYKAMGGKRSIVKWAEKNPPLAQKDFIHLTNQGADTLSKMIAEELFFDDAATGSAGNTNLNNADSTIIGQQVHKIEAEYPLHGKNLAETILASLFRYDPDEPLIFSTPAFWIFFLLVLGGYSLVYRKPFIRNFYLFLVSIFFYYKSGGLFLSLLILITLIDFTCGLLLSRARSRFMRRFFVLISIISNLGILGYFKYTEFIVNNLNDLFGTDFQVYNYIAAFSNSQLGTSFNISNIILPVGISFFTFQSLSYIFDLYRRKMEPVRNVIDFGFYISFFPQLVAGPIVRASEFIPQLYNKYKLGKREFSHALFLITKGLIKKIIISDFIAVNFIDRVFDAPPVYSGFENLVAVYGYGLQIYCDFSGYTDIAIGLGLILGFRFPLNFNSPYKASGISDFWKRWHISLSRWLKDYLYIPLGGNRKGRVRTGINLMITMLLGGLWHGAATRFIIWGGLHGIGLLINKVWNAIIGKRLKSNRIGHVIAVFITFQFVSFCWVFFRAHDMESVKLMFFQIFENFSPGSYLTVIPAYSNVFLLIAVGYIVHFLPENIKESYRGLFIRFPMIIQLSVIMVIAILLFRMRSVDVMPFIYFRF